MNNESDEDDDYENENDYSPSDFTNIASVKLNRDDDGQIIDFQYKGNWKQLVSNA